MHRYKRYKQSPAVTQTYYIETFGCQMNKNDSELMALSLVEQGFTPAGDVLAADIAIFNTCSVREHAENRVISRIRSHRKRIQGRNTVVVVAGCMAQRIGGALIEKRIADMVVGPYQSPDIGKLLRRHLADRSHRLFLSQNESDFSGRINPDLYRVSDTPAWHKWVTITHGCENYCSYCIVPFVRGRLISFPSGEILIYIRALASRGIKEITLLGQNVNQYGMDNNDVAFHTLLESAAGVEGIERINFLTSHPKDFSDDLLRVIRDHHNITRSIHLPLQSGSDRILNLMNRRYTVTDYMNIVEKIKHYITRSSLSTDLIVGFPGESEREFEETLAAVERIRFDDAFTYAYSPRQGTPAYALEEELGRDEKIGRLERLIALQRRIKLQKLNEVIDSVEDSIIERFSKKSLNRVMGRTFLNHIVIMPGTSEDFGKMIQVKINGVAGTTLQGTRIA
ncbi:MAG: tRNA (N6-isopentenyl adenosine(37)-C2)-methylthiotransferase MiaB [Spirochaetes bacterium RBG_13_51_14]|nr:MAG: tRNA (N6-isopentenyl adenosine(37)-C2)-methylthiotransferase MiaB [Spirochaetes bacterium RBG_13_51_14]